MTYDCYIVETEPGAYSCIPKSEIDEESFMGKPSLMLKSGIDESDTFEFLRFQKGLDEVIIMLIEEREEHGKGPLSAVELYHGLKACGYKVSSPNGVTPR